MLWIEVKQETEETMNQTQKNTMNKQTWNESKMASDGQSACETVNKREHQRVLWCECEQ